MTRRAWKLLLASMIIASTAHALPFNDDMVDVQPRAGKIMRPKPEGAISLGSIPFIVADKNEALTLENTRKGEKHSAKIGQRLFAVNCSPCHGDIEAKTYAPGPVAAKFIMPPDITAQFYKDKSDGYLYGVIHFGGQAVMPALGWKLSPEEHWDIVNYVRKVQQSK